MIIAHLDLLLRLHPRGAYDLDEGSLVRADLEVLADGLDEAWDTRDGLFEEIFPTTVTSLLARWEAEYDIQRTDGKTDEERVAAVLARLRLLPSFRVADLESVLTTLCGTAVTITEPFSFFCDDAGSTCDGADELVDGTFLFFAELDEDVARASGLTRAEIDHFISLLQPAHTFGQVRGDDFDTDDAWSLCDLDLLGE